MSTPKPARKSAPTRKSAPVLTSEEQKGISQKAKNLTSRLAARKKR